jgi:hypothetical protein
MKRLNLILALIFIFTGILFSLLALIQCNPPDLPPTFYAAASQVREGTPVSVMLTVYSTTLVANGEDQTPLRIAVTDSAGMEITSASDSIDSPRSKLRGIID